MTISYEQWLGEYVDTYVGMSISQYLGIIGDLKLHEFIDTLSDSHAISLQKTVEINGAISFDPSDIFGAANILYLDSLKVSHPIYAEDIQFFIDIADTVCRKRTFPNAGKALLQYNQVHDVYTSFTTKFASSLKLNVIGCEERCPVTVFGVSDDYDEPQNLGRPAFGMSKFVIDLSGKSGFADVEIRIPYSGIVIEVV